MEYSLKEHYSGRFHSVPNVLLNFLPCDVYMVFAQIYVAGRDVLCNDKIQVSRNTLVKTCGLNRRTIIKCVDKLEKLNLLSVDCNSKRNVLYQINWKEVYLLDTFCRSINYDGECVLREFCISSNTPFSSVEKEKLEKIHSDYHYLCEEDKSEVIYNKDVQNADSQKTEKAFHAHSDSIMVQNAFSELDSETAFHAQNKNETAPRADSEIKKMPERVWGADSILRNGISCHFGNDVFETENGYIMRVVISNAEALLMNYILEQLEGIEFVNETALYADSPSNFQKITAFRATFDSETAPRTLSQDSESAFRAHFSKVVQNADSTYEENLETAPRADSSAQNTLSDARNADSDVENAFLCARNADNKYIIYKNNNIKKILKRKFKEAEGFPVKEKNKKEKEGFKDFFASRNLDLPAFDKTFREDFLQKDLDDDDDDVIKTIKQVWSQLGYDRELPEDNWIDCATFQNILFHSWEYLKEAYSDYSLSEDEIKNIFGFVLVEQDGELGLYIDPDKLQDIHATPTRTSSKKSKSNDEYADRTSRSLFVESIRDVAKDNDELLTDSEYVVLLMLDYIDEHKIGNLPVEVTKLFYEELLKEFSGKTQMPVEDIRELFQDLPQKGKVKLSPQRLLPARFFKYNVDHLQESKVEGLLKEKLARQV